MPLGYFILFSLIPTVAILYNYESEEKHKISDVQITDSFIVSETNNN